MLSMENNSQQIQTQKYLADLFINSFSLRNLRNVGPEELKMRIIGKNNSVSYENFIDPAMQRDLSVRFHWGHNHDFGDGFVLSGNMRNRHIEIIASFIDDYGLPIHLEKKNILDIGVWTGGTSLLLAAMGANVYAIEEVIQYAEMVNYLSFAFGLEPKLRCYSMSLYEFLPMFADHFDYIIYSGVIYHVSDPLLSLRETFTALKDNGTVFLETYGIDDEKSICVFEGPGIYSSGNAQDLNRGGWNYFIPSPLCLERWCKDAGYQIVKIGKFSNKRIRGAATRISYRDFCRAGIAKKDLR